MSVTKTETRTIFDRDKIGVGDLIEYTAYKHAGFLGLQPKGVRIYGIVTEVEDTRILVCAPDVNLWGEKTPKVIPSWVLYVERADDIEVLRRYSEVNVN